uniref:Importin N-terminal domain-containing protein n=1 Tax=Araucaria cunninghamii TaxID=56994 RepID=A0A0D6QYM5_ARACU
MEGFSGVDGDQIWLLNCLNATLDINQDIRSSAEDSLKQASAHPGFGVALAKITINRELPLGLRQLAAVLLKQYVKQHWQEGEENYIPPTVPSADKGVIRNLLLQSLDDPHRKICTAVGMAVASIAQYDWPEEWPELISVLLTLINDQTNMNGVRGALRCLALVSGDLDDKFLPKLVPVLFPCLHTIVSSVNVYDSSMRHRALAILHSCISTLGVMSGVFEEETRELVTPMLKTWLEQFSSILSPPVASEDPDDWGLRMEVFKSLTQMVENYPRLVLSEFSVILEPLWQTFVSSLGVYELASIQGVNDSYAGRADSDGSDQSLEAFIIQLFEFLLSVIGNTKMAKVIKKHVGDLVYYTIAFMQITEDQVETWLSDANQYVADEDDVMYSCRISGVLLLEELVSTYGLVGIRSIIDAVKKRVGEASQAKAVGNPNWWKLREAAILAFGSLSESLVEPQFEGSLKFDLEAFLDDILAQDIGTGVVEFPFLHARAFWAAAKLCLVVSNGRHEQFVYAAMRALALDVPPPVKVGACRALSQLLPRSNTEFVRPHMGNVFSALASLLKEASDETLHLVLESLQAAVKADQQSTVAVESDISPLLLNIWAQHVSDPFISIDAVEVLEAIKDVPGCLHPLVSRVLPSIGPILANPQQQPTGLVAGTLDLLTMLLKNAPVEVVKVIHDVCFHSVIAIILQSDDHSELQNGTECLAAFVLWGKDGLLTWGGDSSVNMKMLLDAAARLLSPDMDSSGSLFVGSYILQLILHLSSYMAPHLRDLVVALVRRMETSEILGLKSSLLLVFARLVHMSSPNVGQFIDLLITVPARGYENSLAYVMSEWTKQQGEIHGSYQIKVTITALCLLLASRHPELAKVYVQGRLKSSTSGIVTRSKAKLAPDQWTLMSLPAKILSLLAEMLIEIQEEKLVADEEDDEWEEVQDEEDDSHADIMPSLTTSSNGRSTFKDIDAMKNILNEEVQDDDYEDDPLTSRDPLNEINLTAYIVNFLKNFSESDRPLFDLLWQDLTERERHAIQAMLV